MWIMPPGGRLLFTNDELARDITRSCFVKLPPFLATSVTLQHLIRPPCKIVCSAKNWRLYMRTKRAFALKNILVTSILTTLDFPRMRTF